MLGVVSCKIKQDKKTGYIYLGKWIKATDRNVHGFFKFRILADEYSIKRDFNKLSGIEGEMTIETKSMLPFENEDIIMFRKNRYNIIRVGNDRTTNESCENAFGVFENNGNLPIIIYLRKAG